MVASSQSWPMWWRVWLMGNLCAFLVAGNWFTACLSPLLGVLAKDFQTDIDHVTHLITYVLLSIGVANIVAVPISQYIGKRYTIIGALIVFLASNIWCVFERRYNAFEAARIIGGLGAGIVEALGPQIVAECFPEHQLASAMAVYVLCLGAGSSIGPFVAGLLDHGGYGWEWNFIILSILMGANLLSCIVMLPETINQDLKLDTKSETKIESQQTDATIEDVEKSVSESTTGYEAGSLYKLWVQRSFFITLPDIKPERNFLLLTLQPWSTLIAPSVALVSIIFGLMIADTVIVSVVLSSTLQQPPILWTPLKVGLINLCTLVGLALGIPIGGFLADVLSRRSAKRNDGAHIRESRLPAVLPGAIVGPLGIIIVGVCLQQGKIWAGLAIGWGMLSIALTAVANVILTYCVDCYPWRAADIGVVVNTLKNVIAFGVGYGVTPWLKAVGPQKQFGTMAGLLWFFMSFVIVLWVWGPKLRQWSLKWIM